MNYEKLNAIVSKSGITVKALAEKMDIARPTLHRKLKGDGVWTVKDVTLIKDALRLTDDEIKDIFLG